MSTYQTLLDWADRVADRPLTPYQRYYALHVDMERMRVAKYRIEHRDKVHASNRSYDARHRHARDSWKSAHAAEYRRRARADTFDAAMSSRFVAFDGEGCYGRYQLLATSATDDVIRSERSLGTRDCLDYFAFLFLRGDIAPNDTIVGYGLSYDFENILRDLSDSQYTDLRIGRLVGFESYDLKYVHRKFLDVAFRMNGRRYAYRLQDIYPYFQQSFVKACESRKIELPEIIYEGKRNRGTFRWRDIDGITRYNRAELTAMVGLATTLRDEFVSAFRTVALTPVVDRRSWYGPGAQAAAVLAAGETTELEVTSYRFSTAVTDAFSQSYGPVLARERSNKTGSLRAHRAYMASIEHPFSSAYFGGRIEAALQGRFDQPLYDYDLAGAYPYAITTLPNLTGSTLESIHQIDERNRMGVYLVRWRGVDDRAFHPFPYRTQNGNVYFPIAGYGWMLSPEVYSALRHGNECDVVRGYVFAETDGYGGNIDSSINRRIREPSTLASLVARMGEERVRAKRANDPAHRGLKGLLNSAYGKTLQKEGSRRYFNVFIAAWITSVTRARIYDLIGSTKPGEVVSVMTDGVLSTVPLNAQLATELGGWELTTYVGGYQFAPGVYELIRSDGTRLIHYRGFLRFDPTKAATALDGGDEYIAKNPIFVSRAMAMHDRKLRKKMYQFAPTERREEFSLASKRDMSNGTKIGGATYYPSKTSLETALYVSWPYDVYGGGALHDLLEEMDELE